MNNELGKSWRYARDEAINKDIYLQFVHMIEWYSAYPNAEDPCKKLYKVMVIVTADGGYHCSFCNQLVKLKRKTRTPEPTACCSKSAGIRQTYNSVQRLKSDVG